MIYNSVNTPRDNQEIEEVKIPTGHRDHRMNFMKKLAIHRMI